MLRAIASRAMQHPMARLGNVFAESGSLLNGTQVSPNQSPHC